MTTDKKLEIIPTETTLRNSYDIILQNEDYTMGKIIEYMLYDTYYKNKKTATFVGFKKEHPHDNFSIIRIAYKNETSEDEVAQHIIDSINKLIKIYNTIHDKF